MSFPRRRVLIGLGGMAAIVGVLMTVVLRSMPIDIGVDLATDDGGVLRGAWSTGEIEFEEISEQFSPHHVTAEILSRPSSDPVASRGYQLIAMAGVDEAWVAPMGAWINISNYYVLLGEERPAQLNLSGWNLGPHPYLSFETDPASGQVSIQSGAGPPTPVDLNTAERGKYRHPLVTGERLRRFYGQVPRKALKELVLHLPEGREAAVRRLYVNDFVPRVYLRDDFSHNRPVGFTTTSWKPPIEAGELALPAAFYLGVNPVVTFLCCSGVVFILFIVVALLSVGVARFIAAERRAVFSNWLVKPVPWKAFLAGWGITFFVWLIFLVSFYPGTMNKDSLSQWEQTRSFLFEPQHPPFYAWCMWVMQQIWDSPFSTTLPQILIGSCMVACATVLLCAGVPRVVVGTVYLLGTFSPRNLTMMISLIKDAPYGMCMFGVALFLVAIALQRDKARWFLWIGLGVMLGLSTLFRHNGPIMVAATMPLLALLFFRQWRQVALGVVVTVVVVVAAKALVLSRLPMAETPGGFHDLLTAHLAILVDRDVPMSDEEYTFLSQVRELEDRWAYDERRVAATTMPFVEEAYHRDWAKEHGQALKEHYISLILRNPLTATRYFWDRGEFLFVPWPTATPMETYFLGIPRNELALSNSQLFLSLPGQLRSLLAWTAGDGVNWLFWRPALPLYLMIVACLVLCFRTGTPVWLVIYMPFLVNTGIVALAGISQASRYQYPLSLVAAFLIGLAFIPRCPQEHAEETHVENG